MSDPIRSISQNNYLLSNGGGGSYTAGEFIDITNDVISVNSGDVSNLIPGSGILITQSSAGTTVSIDPEELPAGGSDETVLWEGDLSYNNSVTLSEPLSSFERARIVVSGGQYNETYTDWSGQENNFTMLLTRYDNVSNYIKLVAVNLSANGSTLKETYNRVNQGTNTWSNVSDDVTHVTRVIGINRKES